MMNVAAHDGYDPETFAKIVEFEPNSWWFRSRNRLIEQTVRQLAPQASFVLQIGCGTGFALGALHNPLPGAEFTQTERLDAGSTIVQRRWPHVRLMRADACALPVRRGVRSGRRIREPIERHDQAVPAAQRVLSPGDLLLVTVPQHAWLWSAADGYARHEHRYPGRPRAGRRWGRLSRQARHTVHDHQARVCEIS